MSPLLAIKGAPADYDIQICHLSPLFDCIYHCYISCVVYSDYNRCMVISMIHGQHNITQRMSNICDLVTQVTCYSSEVKYHQKVAKNPAFLFKLSKLKGGSPSIFTYFYQAACVRPIF